MCGCRDVPGQPSVLWVTLIKYLFLTAMHTFLVIYKTNVHLRCNYMETKAVLTLQPQYIQIYTFLVFFNWLFKHDDGIDMRRHRLLECDIISFQHLKSIIPFLISHHHSILDWMFALLYSIFPHKPGSRSSMLSISVTFRNTRQLKPHSHPPKPHSWKRRPQSMAILTVNAGQ